MFAQYHESLPIKGKPFMHANLIAKVKALAFSERLGLRVIF